jgi:hypothetical protein
MAGGGRRGRDLFANSGNPERPLVKEPPGSCGVEQNEERGARNIWEDEGAERKKTGREGSRMEAPTA